VWLENCKKPKRFFIVLPKPSSSSVGLRLVITSPRTNCPEFAVGETGSDDSSIAEVPKEID
jgi:hypothetical protein